MEVPISSYTSSAAAPPGTTLRRPIAATSTINADEPDDEMMGYEEDISTFYSTSSPNNNNDISSIWSSADDTNSSHGAAAGGGGWMMTSAHPTTWNKRTKILIGLIATTTLLCAIATGGGVAASRAKRANASKSMCVDTNGRVVPVDAVIAAVSAKAEKAATVYTAKSNKTKSPTVKSNKGGYGRRTLEERRRGRVLAATQHGQRVAAAAVEESGRSSGVLTNLWNGFISEAESYYYGRSDKGSDATTTHHHVRRNLQSSKSKSPSYSKSKSPSNKSTKSPTAKSGKASGDGIVPGIEETVSILVCLHDTFISVLLSELFTTIIFIFLSSSSPPVVTLPLSHSLSSIQYTG